MKKVLLVTLITMTAAGIAIAQTTPKPAAKQPAKKEAAAPAKEAKEVKAKDTTTKAGMHHKKHGKAPAHS